MSHRNSSTSHDDTHLSDEQMLELLGPASHRESAAWAHVSLCRRCQAEVRGLEASFAGFRGAMTGFAEAEMDGPWTRPLAPRQRPAPGRPASRLKRQAWAASLAMAMMAFAISATSFHPGRHKHAGRGAPEPRPGVSAVASQSDEALLNDIERDLSTSVAPSLEPLEVSSGPASKPTR